MSIFQVLDNESSIESDSKKKIQVTKDVISFITFTSPNQITKGKNVVSAVPTNSDIFDMKQKSCFFYWTDTEKARGWDFVSSSIPASVEQRGSQHCEAMLTLTVNSPESKLIISQINREEYEAGYENESEDMMKLLIEKYGIDRFGKWLLEIWKEGYTTNPHLCVGILHMVSHVSPSYIEPYGSNIAMAAVSHKSMEVKEFGIKVFENWGDPQYIKVLEMMDCGNKLIDSYRNVVISSLKNEQKVCNNAITA